MKLSTLNESYGGVQTLVEELERESKVLCLRTMATGERSGSIKQVFYNEVPEAVVADQGTYLSRSVPFECPHLPSLIIVDGVCRSEGHVAFSGSAQRYK